MPETGFRAINETIQLSVPTFASPTTVSSVNGWIVIQQRIDGSTSFNETWNAYKNGFGTYNKNFWFGLEKIYQLMVADDYRLRFEILINGSWFSDEHDYFVISSSAQNYKLNVSGYSGEFSDVLNTVKTYILHNGMKFSTIDQDNDLVPTSCFLLEIGSTSVVLKV
ncbi:hypothetical protein HELRODRAFT_81610 [Helobdella robusta]|uniref:Fibrinogen C-terminal domain-containing protein n=1 Tax=Helobdella robusta TaxID=6412 RepID=T1G4G3_HELRO|nr:hypothetical protein HELRODRAFT_81610 [Helobdella robusta]ESO01674.1 hypothetical protein HELRODRAFT_81610 [Helobdella robusta]